MQSHWLYSIVVETAMDRHHQLRMAKSKKNKNDSPVERRGPLRVACLKASGFPLQGSLD